ncbi:Protein TIC 62, chloroplastic [Hondaea fermentalgiana]|uniref:Protein TIC 62, chloroplastic n=1 Tax=Hondaea fermentalgiana TaxID=2315210 RepID=A0A2R5GF42_9STRA|nr:Protein TIC 62, chloroplastic [Hondaea fermentalgiana]|eukprot:GBG27233.1 Protein TIC 62, chloroplastic [Hondaea fermentalgiana]
MRRATWTAATLAAIAAALVLALVALATPAQARAVVREALVDIDEGLSVHEKISTQPLRDGGVWVVSGATGRTGTLAYHALQASGNVDVRALIRNATKAKSELNCGECTESEGIFIGDVTKRKTLTRAMKGADGLVILTGSYPLQDSSGHYYYPSGATPKDIDWRGTVNQILEAKANGVKHIVLVSSLGTTIPDGALDKLGNGHALFYKLNAEATLMQSGLTFSIIKPCGLTNQSLHLGTQVGHCDNFKHIPVAPLISRASIASYVKAIVFATGDLGRNVRFGVCSDPLRPFGKDDMNKLLAAAADMSDC